MGLANDLKGLNMFGRFAPKSLPFLAGVIVILQCVFYSPALAKPRPGLFHNTIDTTGLKNNRQWSNINSIEPSQRKKRSASEPEDVLKDQNGFKVLTDTTSKREGIQIPIEPLKEPITSDHGVNIQSHNQAGGGSSGLAEAAPIKPDSISPVSRSGITNNKGNDVTTSSTVSNAGNDANGQKREEVSKSSTENKNTNNNNDKPATNTQGSHSVTIQGNTINGQPIGSEPVRDTLGNSGSEVVTSHPLFEDRAENERQSYLDSRSAKSGGGGGSKESSNEPEVGHFQVDDKSADLEINANSAGVKVKAKPASLQVVSRPGAHPPTPVVPIAPIHPYYHHHHHHPYFYGYRRSSRPYHRRYYDNAYHAHYRNWIPPPHFHHYWRHFSEEEPSYRRSYDGYPYHHHHRHHFADPESELYDRSREDEDEYPRYRRRFHASFRPRWYDGDFYTRFHIPRMPRPYPRHDIVTPVPPPVNVFGNPPPGILNGSPAAAFFGPNQISPFGAMPGMGPMAPGMFGMGQGMMAPGFMGPGMGAMPGLFGPQMSEPLQQNQVFGGMEQNSAARSFTPRNVKKASIQKNHNKTATADAKKKSKTTKKISDKVLKKSQETKPSVSHSGEAHKAKKRSRRSAEEPTPKKSNKRSHKPRPEKKKTQKGARKNNIVIHRPPIIYHPPPEIYHRPDIVVHRAPIMLHRPAIIYHQPPVVVHRPAIIYHQPSIVFHQPPPVVNQPIMHSHDTYITRPAVFHTNSMVSHSTNYLGIPNHVFSGDFDGGFYGFHGFHGHSYRKHSVPHKHSKAETQDNVAKKSDMSHEDKKSSRQKRDIYADHIEYLDSMMPTWLSQQRQTKPKEKRDLESITTKEAASQSLTYKKVISPDLEKRDFISRVSDSASRNPSKRDKESHSASRRELDEDDVDVDEHMGRRKRKKDVVVNRPPIIYHPPPEVYHRPDIVVHRPPLVIHRPPIIYHQPPVIVHRPAVVYHQPPIVFHQPPPAVSQPLLFSHDSFTVHPSFYATHHGSVVRDYGHYIGIPNIVSNYGAPLFHSRMGKRSKISKPKVDKKRTRKRSKAEKPHKKNSVVIRRPPIIYHPPPEIYHRPDIVVHRAPIMIHRAPIVYHQPPVVVHRPAIVYHQPSLIFHQPPPVVHQPMLQAHDTFVTHSVAVPFQSSITHHTSYVGIPKHAYMNYHDYHWSEEEHRGDHGEEHGGYFKSQVPIHHVYRSQFPQQSKGAARDKILKSKAHKKASKKNKIKGEEKAKKKNSVMIKRPPIIYHPPPEIFHRPDIVVHRPPILVHRAPIIYHQPPVIVHRPAIVYHQPSLVFHAPMPMIHQPIMQAHDTFVSRPVTALYSSSIHHMGAVTTIPHAYFHGHHHDFYSYSKSKVPVSATKEEEATSRDNIKKKEKAEKEDDDLDDGSGSASGSGSGDDDEFEDDASSFESGSGELDIEVVKSDTGKTNLKKSKDFSVSGTKKAEIPNSKKKVKEEKAEKSSKKNSVVIHRPPIIYHPPPEIYHRPDIVVHRAPIVLYRAPIIYHQPPVVVHRPAIVYHQPSIVFHQPPPVVNQPIMHSHDTYVTHSVVVPLGSHLGHVEHYHGVPHEEIYMQGIGHGAFAKSSLPLHKGHKRDKIKKAGKKRSRRSADLVVDVKQPIGAEERIRRAIEDRYDLGEDVNLVLKGSELGMSVEGSASFDRKKRSSNKTEVSKNTTDSGSKKTIIIIRRPPILYHPPSHVIHRPNIMVHRPPIIVHRHPLVIHRPPILVHRMPVIIHRPPLLIHRHPLIVHRPDLVFHRPPVLIHRMPYIVHPHPFLIRRPPIVIHKGPHMMVHHSAYIHHFPTHIIHMGCHGCGCHGGMCGKSKIPKLHKRDTSENHKTLSDNFASDLKLTSQGIKDITGNYKFSSQPDSDLEGPSSFDFKISENPLKQAEEYTHTNQEKHSIADLHKRDEKSKNKKKKKKDVVVSRPPIIYHPPPEVYHRPEIVVHRAPILIHRPPIVYHQPPVVVHRPAVVYHQPPIVFHQPPPAVNQPLMYSHDQYVLHPASVAQHINSVVNQGGHYIGLPHGGISNYPSPYAAYPMMPHGIGLPMLSAPYPMRGGYKRTEVQRPDSEQHEDDKDMNNDDHESSGAGENTEKKSKPQKKKHSKGARKNNVVIYRAPMIYHPPPEIYDRPDIIVHRPDLVVHQPSIVYHQSSVIVHRPPIVYNQPPVVFHQPPPINHQPIATSHDLYQARAYFEPYGSAIQHMGSYTGVPHFYPGMNPYGWGMAPVEAHGLYHGPAFGGPPYEPVDAHGPVPEEPYHGPEFGGPPFQGPPFEGPPVAPAFGPYRPGFEPGEPDFGPYGPAPLPYAPGEELSPAYGRSSVETSAKKSTKGSKKSKKASKKSKVRRRRSLKKTLKKKLKQKKGERKNLIVVHRPPMIYHPPPEIYDRPDVVVHRPDLVFHRPSVVVHQASVVVHRPPIIYHEPPVVFHQPPPMVQQPIAHSHDTYIAHSYYEPYASHVQHAATYVGAPHYYPLSPYAAAHNYATHGYATHGYATHGYATHGYIKSKISRSKKSKHAKHRTRRSTKSEKNKSEKGSKKNQVLIMRPPMIYHPPPEIYDRPSIVVHRPDLVIHRPSIVYHQASVVVHRPPIVYQQPPVVFHQPPPMNSQPVVHAHDYYQAHLYHEPYASHVAHGTTYVGAPHYFQGGWGFGYHAPGPFTHAFAKSKVPKAKDSKKAAKRGAKGNMQTKRSEKAAKHVKKSKSKASKGNKKNLVVMRRPPVVYHPPPEIYHRPDVILHRPDIVIHRPSVVFHQSAVVIHRPAVIYHQPPLVFHQPPPMTHQPIMHSHETYLAHHYFEPHHSHVVHAGTYVGAPHYFHGGWGYGYGYHHGAGHAFGKSTVAGDNQNDKKTDKKDEDKEKEEDKNYDEDEDEDDDDEDVESDKPNKAQPSSKSKRSLSIKIKSKKGHKKNLVIMRRPPVVYHPPPEIYHRPDVVLHRADIVIHRPSVVFHQAPVLVHRPAVVYHQPPIVFHQPAPMVHQPILHSHETYIPHHFFEPHHSHLVHAGTYIGAPHVFHGGWGWGFGHGHAFGKSKVEKKIKKTHSRSKREVKDSVYSKLFGRFQKRSVKESKHLHKKAKKSSKGIKKNTVLIHRPPMIYHPPPEIYDRPDIVVHRPDLVYHQPSVVYHQSSVVVHRPPIVYHPPPVVFHQPAPMVNQNIMHSHDSYIARQYFEPVAVGGGTSIHHGYNYVGAPHFFSGGWGYGYGLGGHAPLPHPYSPWGNFGDGFPVGAMPMYNGYHGPVAAAAHGPLAAPAVPLHGHAFAKSHVERSHKHKSKKSHHHRHRRSTNNAKRHKSKSVHHKGHKKQIVYNRPAIVFHAPPEIYHRPDVVVHRPDIVIHRPDIVMHQAPVVVHKPAIVYHQPPVIVHQPPPLVHQPVLLSHDAYVPTTCYQPYCSHVVHGGGYLGLAPQFAYGKSKVEKSKTKKGNKKSVTKSTETTKSKKANILHADEEKTVRAEKKNDIVVSRPPIIYHPPPEVYHRPDIVVHRAPIVLHRPPIIYHQPPVVVHRPAVVYHQPPIVFHQPPPAVHQPILHSHDTFVVHHGALYEPRGSTVTHQTNYIGIPSHVEQYDAMEYGDHDDHDYHDYHEGFHGGYHGGFHGAAGYGRGYHGRFHGHHRYGLHYRSDIEHAKKSKHSSDKDSSENSLEDEENHKDKARTRTRRQLLGSHSLYLPEESPLNLLHPKGPIVERLQKMSTIPHPDDFKQQHIVVKRDTKVKRRKRQIEEINDQSLQALGVNGLPVRRFGPLAALQQAQPIAPLFQLPRLPYYAPQNPMLGLPYHRPEVRVHVETQRSKIPKSKTNQKRQVLPFVQPQLVSNFNPNMQPAVHLPLSALQMPPQYYGFHPVMTPYPYKRPRVNINVQTARRSKVPEHLAKRGKTGERNKRQIMSPLINPYILAMNARPFSPLIYQNYMNPLMLRHRPEIPHLADDSNNFQAQLNNYLTFMYELYTGELYHHKRPKVQVDVHTTKSDIPGSKPSDAIVRGRRQLLNYLPVSPLTTGHYQFPGLLKNLAPFKRTNISTKSKRSSKASSHTPKASKKQQNSKRDEFMQQNDGMINPNNGSPLPFNGEGQMNAGAEGLNELGPGGLNGATAEPRIANPPPQPFYGGNAGEEQRMIGNNPNFQELAGQQQDQPMAAEAGETQNLNMAQLPEYQGGNRMVVPNRVMPGIPGPLVMPPPVAPMVFPLSPILPAQPLVPHPLLRPFAPLVAPQPLPLQAPLHPILPFAPMQQPMINVNVNTAKSTLPGTKPKKTNKSNKVVKKTINGKHNDKSTKRQQISLFQRMPALQVLPQRFLQDGVQIPTFASAPIKKVSRPHMLNAVVINEIQRKHAIPSKTQKKQTASKRQFFHLPMQPLQTVQPVLAPFAPMVVPKRPRVNVQVNVARKSKLTNDNDALKSSGKVKRQIYGMNELPHGLEFSDDKSNSTTNNKTTAAQAPSTTKDSTAVNKVHKRSVDEQSKEAETAKPDGAKRQFVNPFTGNAEELPSEYHNTEAHPDEPPPLPYAPTEEPQMPFSQHIYPAATPAAVPLVQAVNPFHRPQVNVNVQVAKKSTSNQPKKLTKRQFFGTLPLLASADSFSALNKVAGGSARSNVPSTTSSSKVKRQFVGIAQPQGMTQSSLEQPYAQANPIQPRVNINVQTARSEINRNRRQLYNILSGKQAQIKSTPQK